MHTLAGMANANNEIRPPRQRRSQESFERVLRAGADILRENGASGFTLQTVSERAGVGIGSIYLRVPSREALILAIHTREMDRMELEDIEAISRVMDGHLPGPAHVATVVTEIGALMLRNADILSVFMTLGPSDSAIWAHGAARSQEIGQRFRDALEPVRAEIVHPDPDLAIDMAFRVIYDTIARRISRGTHFESRRDLPDDKLLSELGRMSVKYLFDR